MTLSSMKILKKFDFAKHDGHCDLSEQNEPASLNSPITLNEIENTIRKLKTNKSLGPDGFVNEMFKCSV